MSEISSDNNPQILVNGDEREQPQDKAAAAEEKTSPVSLDGDYLEDSSADAEQEIQAKMQSVFRQVRNHIRSQVDRKAPKSSILDLVQRVRLRESESVEVNSEPEDKDVSSNQKSVTLTDESREEMTVKEQELCAIFEKKLEVSEKTLRDEFDKEISQVRKDMQSYTDQALKELEFKMQKLQFRSLHQTEPKEQQEGKGPNKKQKLSATPSLASRKGRLLTRTMTTITPKTCAPVIIGPRAKSEILISSKGESSQLLLRDQTAFLPGKKPYWNRKPLPPACPPLQERKKPVLVKQKTGN